jgi:membrane protein implicated in regulation of membrane protease activity
MPDQTIVKKTFNAFFLPWVSGLCFAASMLLMFQGWHWRVVVLFANSMIFALVWWSFHRPR